MTRGGKIGQIRYGITKYSVTMEAVAAKLKSRKTGGGKYLSPDEISALPFAAPHRKLARLLAETTATNPKPRR
jgi:hypothetical protein